MNGTVSLRYNSKRDRDRDCLTDRLRQIATKKNRYRDRERRKGGGFFIHLNKSNEFLVRLPSSSAAFLSILDDSSLNLHI